MTTDRPYQESVTREAAIAELRRCSRAQFDPELVELFCAEVAHPLVVRVA
jgi:response regulator RpfG family c-di-GMP phosphodiesterase